MERTLIRTTDPKWFLELAKSYKNRTNATLIDDAKIGIDPINQTLLDMGLKAGLSREEWIGVCTALGMGAIGIVLLVAAILDPEPTSKVGLLIASGVFLVTSGGFCAIRILTKSKPPTVKVTATGFEIKWD